ncbi:hypothetical protein [Solilutibacter silvestris]|uniref:Lipoprotein n=1 Tax=Solilutibacter silvestris TaxID=1645665 RepID=A0A2K1Q0Y5_9GAMM|nr:hypothetical protein [Lysobacter silvestris]PNS08693.1 hypothetical protein Lysil_0322 [Lysobacter silvestris]
MKTSTLAACSLAMLALAGCVVEQPRTSLQPGGSYDPDARIRDAEAESYSGQVIVIPYGSPWGPYGYGAYGYGYPGPYYGRGYGGPWYGYGMPGPVIVPPRHHPRPPASGTTQPRPNNPPRNFRDLFPGAKH